MLRGKKREQTREKRRVIGAMDFDDHGILLPPPEVRSMVRAVSGSNVVMNDAILNTVEIVSTHPNGGFYGPVGQGMNFRNMLLKHPPYVDPMCALAGAYMVNFSAYRKGNNPDLTFEHLKEKQDFYQLHTGIFGNQHLCPDFQIALDLGLDGLEEKTARCRALHSADHGPFYDGLAMVLEGIRGWIMNNARHAAELAQAEPDPAISAHLVHLARMNEAVAHRPPETFEEACQLILWLQMACRSYNGSGAIGRLDLLLHPYYLRDRAAGRLTDDYAIFIIACMLLRDTSYMQLGGYDARMRDTTNEVTYLILEAVDRLKLPSNIGVAVGEGLDRGLLRRSVQMQFANKDGNPRFVGMDPLVSGLMRNQGITPEQATGRTNSGCNWLAIPGREYSLMDCVKINLAHVLDIALREAVAAHGEPSMDQILASYRRHVREAVQTLAEGFAFHFENQTGNCPELPLSLLCHGPVERGLDASNGGVDYYCWGIDGAGLATAADSLAAVEKRVLQDGRYSFGDLIRFLDANWTGPEAEKARLFFCNVDRYGRGNSAADHYAKVLSEIFTQEVTCARPPMPGHLMIPGLFSWSWTLAMGATLGATANGRRRGEAISHGANPHAGFRKDGAACALSAAVASVQPGWGNTAPMQLELEPSISLEDGGVEVVMALIEDHFERGGTLINLNIIDADTLRAANADPQAHPDLVVRVTGFSAYFASLSPEFRQLVVERILDRSVS